MKSMEKELTVYAKIGDIDRLHLAEHYEQHIQLEGKFSTKGRFRARRTISGTPDKLKSNEPVSELLGEYTMTIKIPSESNSPDNALRSNMEHTTQITQSFFEAMELIAEKKQIKKRYFFKTKDIVLTVGSEKKRIVIPTITYEVDIFKKHDDSIAEYCKIDLEVQDLITYLKTNYPQVKQLNLTMILSSLPFKPSDFLIMSNEEDRAKIERLYLEMFNIPLQKEE